MTETTIDLLRHGEPVGGRKYRGQSDDPLSELGWTQMRRAVGDACPWGVIVSSPLRRCAAFAEELALRHGRPWHLDPDLQEVGFGVWEGETRSALESRSPGAVRRFYDDPVTNRPEGAEPLDAFLARVQQALGRIRRVHRGGHVLVVGHAGVIRAAVADVLGMPPTKLYRLQVANAGFTRLSVDDEGAVQLVFHGAQALPDAR